MAYKIPESYRVIKLALLFMTTAGLFFVANVAAQDLDILTGQLCPGEYVPINCTSNDVSIASIIPDPLVEDCIQGEDLTVQLTATIQLNSAAARRDVGIWISEDAGDPSTDTPDDSSLCLVGTFPNEGIEGFGVATGEDPLDACGDALVKGTVVEVNMGEITLPCIPDANGDLVIQPVVTWVIDKTFDCSGPDTVRPGSQRSKCEAGPVILDIVVIVPAGLTITKVIESNNGGSATLGDFNVTVGDVEVDWGVDDTSTTSGSKLVKTSAGDYLLSEGTVDDYTNGTWSCRDNDTDFDVPVAEGYKDIEVAVGEGQSVVCIITNTDDPAKLTLIKEVINLNDGTAEPKDWTLTAVSNGVVIDFIMGDTPPDPINVNAGTYTLSEIGPDGYTPTLEGWSCDGDGDQTGSEITLTIGQSAVCTITNEDIPPDVFFEGIPSLNQYSMAILALLMLGIGVLGFRRFS